MEKILNPVNFEEPHHDIYKYIKAFRETFSHLQDRKIYLRTKTFTDLIFVAIAIVLLTPILTLVPILIKLNSKGPILFKQKRIGKNLKPFYIYKFRTMVKDANLQQSTFLKLNEMTGGGLFKCNNDPRITSVGRFLRKYSIDELPQLINILKGEMTVIGPRPLSTPIELYQRYQLKRFLVKPGLGCIWQAYYRRETNFDKWIKTDLLYLKKASPWFDAILFIKILINVIRGKGAR